MAKTGFSVCTIIRLPVPTEATRCRAWSKIECTEATHIFIWCCRWFRALARFISMWNRHLFSITAITNCDMHRTTGVQCIVIYSVWSLIGMNLLPNETIDAWNLSGSPLFHIQIKGLNRWSHIWGDHLRFQLSKTSLQERTVIEIALRPTTPIWGWGKWDYYQIHDVNFL